MRQCNKNVDLTGDVDLDFKELYDEAIIILEDDVDMYPNGRDYDSED